MKVEQARWTAEQGWTPAMPGPIGEAAHLALIFGGTAVLRSQSLLDAVRQAYPQAHLLGCSTAGEIFDTQVTDDTLVVTAVQFEHSAVRGVSIEVNDHTDSYEVGKQLAAALLGDGLAHVFVISDGLLVNGSDLVRGISEGLPETITVTGGLSADGPRFEETLVVWNSSPQRAVAAIGLYGDRLKIGYGSLGGWDPFGPERRVTRSKGNVLYELDGQPALSLYKTYLGEQAAGLPATGLLFPLSLRAQRDETPVVRTILAVSDADQSMTFAGDLPEGSYARLMKANFERLIDGAMGAARTSYEALETSSPDLAILISCVGRKLILQQRIEEEVEGVREVLGDGPVLAGFYSYGEISPFTPGAKCDLHNQTMTITTFSEQ